ncbi:MAG: hypothetical protein MJK08_05230 [Campylobacterales bacterium]|nr:hypothetical protein [Campylobacterales bacterium]
MQKKSIVLLITILFITTISALILKNLKSSEDYISASNKEYTYAQALLLVKNAQNELLGFFSNEELYDNYISSKDTELSVPLNFKDINFILEVKPYKKEFNINHFFIRYEDEKDVSKRKKLKKKRDNFNVKIEEFFLENHIDIYLFREVLDEYKFKNKLKYNISDNKNQIRSSKQINTIIRAFKKKSNILDTNILENELGFFDKKDKDDKKNRYLTCSLNFEINNHRYFAKFILNLNKNKTGVEDFEFTFK